MNRLYTETTIEELNEQKSDNKFPEDVVEQDNNQVLRNNLESQQNVQPQFAPHPGENSKRNTRYLWAGLADGVIDGVYGHKLTATLIKHSLQDSPSSMKITDARTQNLFNSFPKEVPFLKERSE
ncbi:hypothetical protein P4S91_23685 [Aneurinibacillus aneurinilyticus]|nr:hypothetical protein [Aneurinibacillus aneurinilyticus]